MNMMNGDIRPERERKPLQELIQRSVDAFIEQAAEDEGAADTVRAFMRANDIFDYQEIPEAVACQVLYREDLPLVVTDLAMRMNALIESVGSRCFDEFKDGQRSKSEQLSALIGDAHAAANTFSKPASSQELFSVLWAGGGSKSDPSS